MNREEHNRIVQAGLKKMGVKEIHLSDLERLLAECNKRYLSIKVYIQGVEAELRHQGKDTTSKSERRRLSEECQTRLLDAMHTFDKDELLFLLCARMASEIL